MVDKTIPAFPLEMVYTQENEKFNGMTLRDYFAARAMQGMLAACTGWSDAYQERMAKASYMMADEMLKRKESNE
jgi:hypothetical protein